jgi:hypothetical protein
MKNGSLGDLHIDPAKWTSLAAELKNAFPSTDEPGTYVNLCTAYYRANPAYFGPKSGTSKINLDVVKRVIESGFTDPADRGLIEEVVQLVDGFMNANGQWPYLLAQSWFTGGKFFIAVEVNYYPQRSTNTYTMSPLFHKDTPGDNIFVNLLFDNKGPIAATEWFVDVQDPSGKRAALQQKLLPPAHLQALANLRGTLRGRRTEQVSQLEVHGGVLAGENAYVSWLDDLVWHATPTTNQRIVYEAKYGHAAWDVLSTLPVSQFYYQDGILNAQIDLVELLGTIADDHDTALFRWLGTQGKTAQDIDPALCRKAWDALYGVANGGKDNWLKDVDLRGRNEWRMIGQAAQAIVANPRLAAVGNESIRETPAGLSTIRRANSLGKDGIADVIAQNATVPRSFLRTWMRILHKDAKEALAIAWPL